LLLVAATAFSAILICMIGCTLLTLSALDSRGFKTLTGRLLAMRTSGVVFLALPAWR
jgi:hypothetical protein